MQNTEIAFLYRDASNYKRLTTHVVKGEITETQKKKLLDSLECYDERTGFGYCIPEQLGIEIDRFDEYEQDEDDHCWAEKDSAAQRISSHEKDIRIKQDSVESNNDELKRCDEELHGLKMRSTAAISLPMM